MLGGHPEYLYWALILVGVLPLAPINRVAAIVVAARISTQIAYDAALPEIPSQIVVFAVAGVLALHNARAFNCFLSAALFIPLAVCAAWQYVNSYEGWWAVFWCAVAQAAILIASGEWKRAVRHWLRSSCPDRPDVFTRIAHAFARRLYA